MWNIVIMPLRKGSKSIVEKNIRLFCGKPLFTWYLETTIKSGLADEIWVATDCDKVTKVVNNNYPEVLIFNRSTEPARDTSPTNDVVLEFLNKNYFHQDDNLILIQATSPLTSITDLQHLFEQIKIEKYDSIVACLRMNRFRWTEDGQSLDYEISHTPIRRQDYRGFLVQVGAFYYSKVGNILKTGQLISGNVGIVEVGQDSVIDIDEPVNWVLGEAYMNFLKKNSYGKGFLLGVYTENR